MTATDEGDPRTAERIDQADRLPGRALKAPRIREAAARLGDQARDAGWSHEEYLAAVLDREVSARDASGAQLRIRAAGFGTAKTIEDFDFDHQPGTQAGPDRAPGHRHVPGQGRERGPPRATRAPARPTSRSGSASKPPKPATGSLFATATEWVTRLQAAHHAGRLADELTRLRRYRLLIVDEVGYIPFEQDAANLFFQLVSSRYEHASLILTSNLPFARWGDVFGDQVVAAAMIDRIVHHAEVITLKGSSHRLRNTGIDTLPSARAENTAH